MECKLTDQYFYRMEMVSGRKKKRKPEILCHPVPPQDKCQYNAGNKSTNMCHVCDTPGVRSSSNRPYPAEQLQDEPQSDNNQCRHLGYSCSYHDPDTALREQQKVRPENPGNCT